MSVNNPTCPSGCSAEPPIWSFNFCDPKTFFGEITQVFMMAYDGSALTDVEDLAEWTSRINNSTTGDADVIRRLWVTADMPAAEGDEIEISNDRKVFTPKTFTINVSIDDVSDLNYAAMRELECNTQYRIWFATRDHIYGGTDGLASDANMNLVIPTGKKEIQMITGTIKWESKFHPERNDSPFAS